MKKGQALLELAVFGTIILSLLGTLISYGLRYNWQQRLNQQSFRKALTDSYYSMDDNKPIASSYLIVRDVHVPNPSDGFGIGSITPMIGSSGGISRRTFNIEAENNAEQPRQVVDINNNRIEFIIGANGTVAGIENYTQTFSRNDVSSKVETPGGITTTDNFGWQASVRRSIVCDNNCTVPVTQEVISVLFPDLTTQTLSAGW